MQKKCLKQNFFLFSIKQTGPARTVDTTSPMHTYTRICLCISHYKAYLRNTNLHCSYVKNVLTNQHPLVAPLLNGPSLSYMCCSVSIPSHDRPLHSIANSWRKWTHSVLPI